MKLTWTAMLTLLVGVAALLLLGTVWVIPMALASHDPRLVGTAVVGAGLVLSAVAVRRHPRGRRARSVLVVMASVAILLVGMTFGAAPYRLEDVEFTNAPATLSGTLVLPSRGSRHPAVVLMHGSGPEDRGLSFLFAERYARAGVAALIYDKRGSGSSTGGSPRDPYSDLSHDALAAVDRLRIHPAIDSDRIGLWGLSEGGWTAPLAASMAGDTIAFIVIVSGAGASTQQETLFSIRTQLEDAGIDAAGVDRALGLRRQIDDYYRTGIGLAEVQAEIGDAEATDWFRAAGAYLPVSSEVYTYGSDAWRAHLQFLEFDALPLLRDLDLPMLFIHGSEDRSFPSELSAARLQELDDDPSRDVTVVTFEGADHAIMARLLPWPEYADGYLELMVDWVATRVGTDALPAEPS